MHEELTHCDSVALRECHSGSSVCCYATRRYNMKLSTKYRLNGIIREVKGTFRVIAGKISSNRSLGAKGKMEQIAGRLQGKLGRVQGVIGL